MHEYGLVEAVVESALEACTGQRGQQQPVVVRIQVGEFAFASRDSLDTAFEILTRGTLLEGARLDVEEVPGRAKCEGCGWEGSAGDLGLEPDEPPLLLLCPRCGSPLLVTTGAGVALAGIQLRDRGSPGPRNLNPGGQ